MEVGEGGGEVVHGRQLEVLDGAGGRLHGGRRERCLVTGRKDRPVGPGRLCGAEQRADVLGILQGVEDEHERRLAPLAARGRGRPRARPSGAARPRGRSPGARQTRRSRSAPRPRPRRRGSEGSSAWRTSFSSASRRWGTTSSRRASRRATDASSTGGGRRPAPRPRRARCPRGTGVAAGAQAAPRGVARRPVARSRTARRRGGAGSRAMRLGRGRWYPGSRSGARSRTARPRRGRLVERPILLARRPLVGPVVAARRGAAVAVEALGRPLLVRAASIARAAVAGIPGPGRGGPPAAAGRRDAAGSPRHQSGSGAGHRGGRAPAARSRGQPPSLP